MLLISEAPQAPWSESTTGLEEQQEVESLTGLQVYYPSSGMDSETCQSLFSLGSCGVFGDLEGLIYLKDHLTLPGIIPLRDFSGPDNTSHMLIATRGQGVAEGSLASQGFQSSCFS